MNLKLDYDALVEDLHYSELIKSCDELKDSILKINKAIEECVEIRDKHYDKLTKEDRIELNLFMAYALNGCYWMALQLNGIDPSDHPIKHELDRIKKIMIEWKQVKDLKYRPKVNKEAAKRFIRSGLWDPNAITTLASNKKIKIEEED